MRVEVQDVSEVEKIVKVKVPEEEVTRIITKVIRDVGKKAKVKGFREGKVPPYLVKKLFKEEIEEKSIEQIIENTLPRAIKETQLEPLFQPRVEEFSALKEGEEFTYSVRVDIRPEIKLKREDYIGLEVERDRDEVSEDEVEKVIEEMRYSFAELKKAEPDEEIKERDVVVIKFEAFDGEKPIPGHQADALFVDVGTGEFNETIEKALVGKKTGDKFAVEVEYPEEGLNPLLAGKKVRYEIEVKEVYKRKLKELTDEFVKSLNLGFETVEALKEGVRKRLLEEKKRRNQSRFRERLLEKILEKVDFKVPERYIEFKLNQLYDQVQQSLERDGFSLEKLNISPEKLEKRLRPVAERQAKEELILEKIAELEDIEISQEEIEKDIEAISKGLNISVERARGIVYFNILPKKLAEKTLKFLEENAKPVEKES